MSRFNETMTIGSGNHERFTTLDFVGHDDWGRPVYRIIGTDIYLKDTELGQGRHNPHLHWSSPHNDFYGEPDCRYQAEKEIRFISTHEYELPFNAQCYNKRTQEESLETAMREAKEKADEKNGERSSQDKPHRTSEKEL